MWMSPEPLRCSTALALLRFKVLRLPIRTVRQMLVDFIWDSSGQIQSILLNCHFNSHHAITKWPKRQFDQLLTGRDRNFYFVFDCVSRNVCQYKLGESIQNLYFLLRESLDMNESILYTNDFECRFTLWILPWHSRYNFVMIAPCHSKSVGGSSF